MSTQISNIFTINGVIDTSKNVKDNLDIIAAAASSWVTFDIHEGKWSVVVNEPGSSVASFTDSNIIGGINVSGNSLTELYNKVQLEFPHKDLNDRTDTITYEIPSDQRYPYEFDNVLNYQFDCINDPVQAEYLAFIQLKQNRVDKVIQFRTDFSKLGIKAGDIIDVTNSMYGFTNKLFRVLSIAEEDASDHSIVISITAFEYDSGVYSSAGLIRAERTTLNNITSSCTNTAIADSQQASNNSSLMKLLIPLALTSLFNMMFPKLNKKLFEALASPKTTVTSSATNVCEGNSVVMTVATCCSTCNDLSGVEVDYEITGVIADDINVPLTGKVTSNSAGVATLTIATTNRTGIQGDRTLTFTAGGTSKTVTIKDRKTYALVASPASITEGGSTTVTITTTGVDDGAKPFTITGSGTGQLSGTPTSGSLNISGGSATLVINTKDTASLTDTSVTLNFDPGVFYCSGASITIPIAHNGTPVTPPYVPPDTNCEYVTIPSTWCGSFDGTTGDLKSVFPIATVTVLKAISGQSSITVPLTATVSGTTISVATSVAIDANTSRGGRLCNIITSFNAFTPGVKRITGTTVQVIGN